MHVFLRDWSCRHIDILANGNYEPVSVHGEVTSHQPGAHRTTILNIHPSSPLVTGRTRCHTCLNSWRTRSASALFPEHPLYILLLVKLWIVVKQKPPPISVHWERQSLKKTDNNTVVTILMWHVQNFQHIRASESISRLNPEVNNLLH